MIAACPNKNFNMRARLKSTLNVYDQLIQSFAEGRAETEVGGVNETFFQLSIFRSLH